MGKSTISMAIFNSYVNVYQRVVPKPSSKAPGSGALHVLRPCLRRLAPVLLRAEALLRRAQAPPEVAGFASGRGAWEGGKPKTKGIVIYI